jgi:peptide chain release factor 2
VPIQNGSRWQTYLEDLGSAIELLLVEYDADLIAEAQVYCDRLTHELNLWEIKQLLCHPYDIRHVRLSIKTKTEDSGDWAGMLLQMYVRWTIRQNYKLNVIEETQDTWGRTQSVTLEINGWNAYGYLKMENGVHCLRRLSPSQRKGKFENSLTFVQVVPIVDDEITIEIPPEHFDIVNYTSQPWLRNRNKTDIGVRATHLPTGLFFCAMLERNQLENHDKAIAVLTNQLFWIMQQYQLQDLSQIRGSMLSIDWHHPIRQYRFEPKPLIEDNRTGYTSTKIHEISAGEIDNLLESGIRGGFNDRIQTSANPP